MENRNNLFKTSIVNFSKDIIYNINNNPKSNLNKVLIDSKLKLEKIIQNTLGLNIKFIFVNNTTDIVTLENTLLVLAELKEYLKNENTNILNFTSNSKLESVLGANDIKTITKVKSIIDDYRPIIKNNRSVILSKYDKQILLLNTDFITKYELDSDALAAILVKAIGETLGVIYSIGTKLDVISNILGLVIANKNNKIDASTFKSELSKYLNTIPDNNKDLIKEITTLLFDIRNVTLDNCDKMSFELLAYTELTDSYVRFTAKYAKENIGHTDKNRLFILNIITDALIYLSYLSLVFILSPSLLIPLLGIIVLTGGLIILKLTKKFLYYITNVIYEFISIAMFGRIYNKYEKLIKELKDIKQYNIQLLRTIKDKDLKESIKRSLFITFDEINDLLSAYPKLKDINQYAYTDDGITNMLNDSIKELKNNDLYILNAKLENN